MWSRNFATRRGAGIAEILRVTGYGTYGEFVRETDPLDRRLTVRAIEQYNRERESEMPRGP
jgi:hypothetical protein